MRGLAVVLFALICATHARPEVVTVSTATATTSLPSTPTTVPVPLPTTTTTAPTTARTTVTTPAPTAASTTTNDSLPATPVPDPDADDADDSWTKPTFYIVVAMSIVVLLLFMIRSGGLASSLKWLRCLRPKYRPLAMDDLGQMEMSRLNAAENEELDADEEETIFDAGDTRRR